MLAQITLSTTDAVAGTAPSGACCGIRAPRQRPGRMTLPAWPLNGNVGTRCRPSLARDRHLHCLV
jgi:hypothetical protein